MAQFPKEPLKQTISKCIALVVIGAALFFGGMFCKTFNPIEVKGYKKECNDKLTVMRMMVMLKITDTGTLKTEQEKCEAARKLDREIKKRNYCREEAYGHKPIDPSNFKLHNQFLKCIQNLN